MGGNHHVSTWANDVDRRMVRGQLAREPCVDLDRDVPASAGEPPLTGFGEGAGARAECLAFSARGASRTTTD